MAADPAPHVWKFFRCGGLDQPLIESSADLLALGQLDQKLWVALSCPIKGLQLDERTLALIDTDGDGHIRPPELIAAVAWSVDRLKDPQVILNGEPDLKLDNLNTASPEGRALMAAAQRILSRSNRAQSPVLRVEDTLDSEKLFQGVQINGDGVLPPEAAGDAGTRSLISEIMVCQGSEKSRSGLLGVTRPRVDAFFTAAETSLAWYEQGTAPTVAFLREVTPAAAAAFFGVRSKVDDFFGRCRLASFDPRAIATLNREPEDLAPIAAVDLSVDARAAYGFPLSRIEPGRPLPLSEGLNPAWSSAMASFRTAVVIPLLGTEKASLSLEEWTALCARFAPYEAWSLSRPEGPVARLESRRLLEVFAGRAALEALFAEDLRLAPEFKAIADAERLVRYVRDLRTLLNNFVNFSDFYRDPHNAIFQAGRLYLDGRTCRLCIPVVDPAAHAELATMSRAYLAYLECRRPGGETMSIAACFTQGDSDYLFVGRNGVFYDWKGLDWDARIVKLVENPISVLQAFWTPYKRVAKFVQDQFEKFAQSKDKAIAGPAPAAAPAPPGNFDIAKFAGIFAAIGLALGAMGGAIASVATGFLRLQPWQMPLAVVGALLLVSGPAMIVAAIRLHQRNLGPLLEANGWAVNGRVKITTKLGEALTERAELPAGSAKALSDPFEETGPDRQTLVLIGTLLAVLVWLQWATRFHAWPFR